MEEGQNCKVLKIKRIKFRNGKTLDNAIAAKEGDFLIVALDAPGYSPSWYNMRDIEAMYSVTYCRNVTEQKIRLYPFEDAVIS